MKVDRRKAREMSTMDPQATYRALPEGASPPVQMAPMFENPFTIEDLQVFDDETLGRLACSGRFGLTIETLAWTLQGVPENLVARVRHNLPVAQQADFVENLQHPISPEQRAAARRTVLDNLFWELTYWKTPDLYEELTEGEQIHPEIFQRLEPDIRGKVVLDVGAGSGRASFECLRYAATRVYAVEPSPGLLRILKRKLARRQMLGELVPCRGRFDAIPLEDNSVDIALSCSAFTALPEQGGEPGLQELRRVTKPGGKIVLIWIRTEDQDWLTARGFTCTTFPSSEAMAVRFRSLESALRCARRFYAHNAAVTRYLLERREPNIPFSVLGFNPPCDYCWTTVQ